jgi:flagellar basal body-associated protein FliL
MNDFDMYIAKTQRQLAFFIIIVLVVLSLGVAAFALFPNAKLPQEISGLIVQVVTGVLALSGTVIGYFFARHRPQTKGDEENIAPNTTVSKEIVSKTVSQSPPLDPTQPEKKI